MQKTTVEMDAAPGARDPGSWWQSQLRRALHGMQFGSVELIVHDARVVQIVRTEKFRADPASPEPRGTR